jgi:hypothetical protein
MSNVFVLPKQVPLTSAGRVYPGAKAYFYRTGTNTPKAVYSDADHMNPITQPVTADLGGTFPVVYLDTSDYEYRVTINTSGDALIYTVDDVGGTLTQDEFDALLAASTAEVIGAVLYGVSAAEFAAGVTPTNYRYNPDTFDPRRYGGVGNDTADDTTPVQTSLTVAGVKGGTVKLPPDCTFKCTANLTVPTGINTAVSIEGPGMEQDGAAIHFVGAAVTRGFNFSGSTYSQCGEIRNVYIRCSGGALRGVTFTGVNNGVARRVQVQGVAGCAFRFDTTLLSKMADCLMIGCGSATEGVVEVFDCTTWVWDNNYMSSSGVGSPLGGLLIDKTRTYLVLSGAIESVGPPILIGSKADAATGCTNGLILNVNIENPGTNNPYIKCGSGLSGVYVSSLTIMGPTCFTSGTSDLDYAVQFENCLQVDVSGGRWGQIGSPVATFNLSGSNNLGINIRAQRSAFGNTWPWVYQNGVHITSAGPHADWSSDGGSLGLAGIFQGITGATPSILVLAAQGGFYRHVSISQTGATPVTALTGGRKGMEIFIQAADGNSTLTHSVGTADQFNLIGGVNLNLASNRIYHFIHSGVNWVQV